MVHTLLTIWLIVVIFVVVRCQNLQLVTVLFRHGDRTPDPSTLYPLDPHINESYYPIGLGHLTNRGKQRSFNLGQFLRKRYDTFLGNDYYPDLLEALSTNYARTKATLQLVLAGAFPPKTKELDWNPSLNWQPIPYNYTGFDKDIALSYSYNYCPTYAKLYDKYMKSQPGLDLVQKHAELFEYLTRNTGSNLKGPIDLWGIYTCLMSQQEWGLKLPQWTDAVFPDAIGELTVEMMRTHVATPELKQLSGGNLLKKIVNNMVAKSKNQLCPKDRKLILYSAHDLNILYMSAILDQAITQTIPYSSYYILELVEKEGLYSVRIFRNNYTTYEINPVKVPGCEFSCPLGEFIRILKKYIPNDDKACWNN